MAMNADGIKTENAWQSRATELAAFTLKRFAVRNDVCGVYSDDGQSSTKHLGGGDDQLRNILQQHFAGTQVCGLHSQNADWQTRWFAVDLDCKEWYPDREERAWRNKTYAYLLKDRLESRGFNVLIESSNGIGGFHVWVLLDGYVPAAWVHHLLREIVSDAEDCGFGKFLDANDKKQNDLPEVFPKKDRPSKDRIGNWLRFPGRHHRLKKHWSYFLDDDGLAMTFEDSVNAWLKFPESDASLVPEYVLPEIPKPEPRKIPANAGGVDGCRAAAESFIDAMNWDELLTSFGWQDCGGGKWRRPGKPEGSNSAILNDVGLHVFSSAVDNLEAEETYGRWRFYVCSLGLSMEGQGQIEAARELLGRAKADEIDKESQRAFKKANEGNLNGKADVGRFQPRSAWDAVEHPAKLRECVIEGLARRGEVINTVAATKVGKSWLALGLLFSVATGTDWLGRRVLKGDVLLLDNELHDETIQNRTAAVAREMKLKPSDTQCRFDYIPLRGEAVSISELQEILSKYHPGDLTMIVLDAKYRFFGNGKQENSNDDQTEFHNAVDRLAMQLDCVIVLIHHSSKGDQGGKGVVDVGSGGGSQARAVDCHLVIRPHAEPGLAVLDAAVRTFIPVEPQTIRWNFPIWSVADGVLPILKQERTRSDSRQESKDQQAISTMVEIFSEYEYALTRKALRTATGFGLDRINRLLRIGIDSGTFQAVGSKTVSNGEEADLFELAT